ncbi:hypothetical protein [Streptomyces sp. NPDC002779]|uniref:hypothetical protein n=1 Tax=Streptomyces sp. NPDC002779 TaxID=3364664 RepID=UPI003699E4A9
MSHALTGAVPPHSELAEDLGYLGDVRLEWVGNTIGVDAFGGVRTKVTSVCPGS